jgi:hypothetical protein
MTDFVLHTITTNLPQIEGVSSYAISLLRDEGRFDAVTSSSTNYVYFWCPELFHVLIIAPIRPLVITTTAKATHSGMTLGAGHGPPPLHIGGLPATAQFSWEPVLTTPNRASASMRQAVRNRAFLYFIEPVCPIPIHMLRLSGIEVRMSRIIPGRPS